MVTSKLGLLLNRVLEVLESVYVGVQDALGAENMDTIPTNDLRKAKAAFIKHVMNDVSTDEKERFAAALAKWMKSDVRAALMAGRKLAVTVGL